MQVYSFYNLEFILAPNAREIADEIKNKKDKACEILKTANSAIWDAANNGEHEITIIGTDLDHFHVRDTILHALEWKGYEAHYYNGEIYVRWDRAILPKKNMDREKENDIASNPSVELGE